MVDLAGLIVKVTPKGIKETIDQLKKLAHQAGKAEDAADKLDKKVNGAGGAIHEFSAKVNMLNGGALSTLKAGLIALPFALVAKKIGDLGVSIVKTGAQFEVMSRQLEAVMGSKGGAEKALAWIDEFTLKTPLQVEETAQAFNMLKAIGIDPMSGSLQALVDATSFTAQGFEGLMGVTRQMGQAWAKDRLAGEEILRLRERMIPVFDLLADKMGKSTKEIQKMSEKGELTRKHILLLFEAMGEKYAGAAEKQMDTLTGKISNLQQAWTFAKREMAEAGALEGVKVAVDSLADALQSAMDTGLITKFGQAFGKLVAAGAIAIQELIAGWTAFKLAILTTTQAMLDAFASLEDPLKKFIEKNTKFVFALLTLTGKHGGELFLELIDLTSGAGEASRDMQADIEALTEKLANQTSEILKNKAALAALVETAGEAKTVEKELAEEVKPDPIFSEEEVAALDALLARAESAVASATQEWAAQERAIEADRVKLEQFVEQLDVVPEKLKEGATEAKKFSDEFQQSLTSMFGATFRSALTAEFDDIEDFFVETFADIGTTVGMMFIDQFVEALLDDDKTLKETWQDLFGMDPVTGKSNLDATQRAMLGIGGAVGLYQTATEGPGGASGALSGAMSGAMIGAATGSGIGMLVGAIIGGAIGYFTGRKEDQPWVNVNRIGPGNAWEGGRSGVWTRGGAESAQSDRMLSMGVFAAYRDINRQWRELLRGLGDSELFSLLGEMPEIIDKEFQLSASEFQTWLTQDKLPRMFQNTYKNALNEGLKNLGFMGDALDNLWDEIRDMPGDERMQALSALVGALKGAQELLETDFAALEGRLGMSLVDQFSEFTSEAADQMEMLTAGWDDMLITERAADLQNIGLIFESVTQATLQALQQIDAIAKSLNQEFEAMIRGFETRGMSEEQLWGYLEQEFRRYEALRESTTDPTLIAEYSQRIQAILGQAAGMIPDELWGQQAGDTGLTWQEWFISMTRGAQEAADEAIQEQRDRIEDSYNALFAGFDEITNRFNTLANQTVPEATDAITGLGGAALDVADRFYDVRDALDGFLGRWDMSTKGASMSQPIEMTIEAPEPPIVNVTINGSLAVLQAMVSTEVERQVGATKRTLKVIS